MNEYPALLRTLLAGRDLEAEQMAYAIGAMMDAAWSAVQAAAFLAALATKGESWSEVLGAAQAMRARSLHVEHDLDVVVDTCGTGGDGAQTINVSTAAGFVIAGCGLYVAKHGNRAASSSCGSADVLEAAGVRIDGSPEEARRQLESDRFAFLFAPNYHPAMKEIAPVRRELGVRTVFNILGPLANPARATHQVIGVASPRHLELVGRALESLGARGGAVVHAQSGIDEVAGDAPTQVYEFGRRGTRRWLLDPADVGIFAPPEALAGGAPVRNAAALVAILEGESSARADVVALNAALLLVVAERAEDLAEGLALSRASLRSGAALAVFERARRPSELEFA
ncbi:MAG: anthranilate phosphoribosyltransferase [Candidatus Eremiobacteraeota bacterium]|nr:anthranilate phosphoribosyltransferase [Candidatus Eremiobacteraeota bacterium]